MANEPGPTPVHPLTPEQEERRQQLLLGYQRSFAWVAVVGLLVAAVGITVGVLALRGQAQGEVIAVFGGGGLLLAWMCLVIRKRFKTGPKSTFMRWPLNRVGPPS